jgi:hypothetical protein
MNREALITFRKNLIDWIDSLQDQTGKQDIYIRFGFREHQRFNALKSELNTIIEGETIDERNQTKRAKAGN